MKGLFKRFRIVFGVVSLSALTLGCATNDTSKPARLTTVDATTMTKVRTVLAGAIGRTQFELGPEDMTTSSSISVLPPPLVPLETRSLAVPIVFDIALQNGRCVLVARADRKTYPLGGVRCSAVEVRKE